MENQSHVPIFFNNSLPEQKEFNNNSVLYSHTNELKESSLHCNTTQPFKIPASVNEMQQKDLSQVNSDSFKSEVHSQGNNTEELSKDILHTKNIAYSKENCSPTNAKINLVTSKEESATTSADKAQNHILTLHERILMNRKQSYNSWFHNKPEALHFFLNSTLDTIVKQTQAVPFLHPVDAHKIKDYYDIVKYPMDLSTIRKKLRSGQYQSGWEFVDDVWLMFNNAWLYNKKNSRIYKYCSTLSVLFRSIIDKPMRRLGYCCGQYYESEPKYIFCCISQNCIIPKFAAYWSYDKYQICKKCYSEFQDKVIIESAEDTLSVDKEEFVTKVNDVTKKEVFVKCCHCKIKCHKICVLHLEDIWKDGYICHTCLRNLWKFKSPNKFSAGNLPQTKLGSHIEERVNNYLESAGCKSRVIIRIVHQANKSVDVKPGAQNRFVKSGIWPNQFPYTSKTLLAFQQYCRMDVCFFAMFLQEYDSECPYPNTRRVYISYLDSVHFFTPRSLKTPVYHEIFLGYLDYVKKRGFTSAHLWSCPSKKGEDYVFHCHPKDQKNPSMKQLLSWYRTMLDKGIEEGVVKDYKDVYREAVDSNLNNACELPYFEGDYWPNALENEISKLDGCVKNNISPAMTETESPLVSKLQDKKTNEISGENQLTKCKKNNKVKKTSKSSSHPLTSDPLTDKIMVLMHRFREVFLVIHLEHDTSDLPTIVEQDPSVSSDLMCSRETFLEFCRDNDYEFSSLRRARYSTLAFVYELHKEKTVTFFCNHCKKIIRTGVHCNVCKDFDLCSDCYNLNGHDHEVEALKVSWEFRSYFSYIESINPAYFLKILDFMDTHVSVCNDANCLCSHCKNIRCQIEHVQNCKFKKKQCFPCFYFLQLVFKHSKTCKIETCQICKKIKISVPTLSEKFENGTTVLSNVKSSNTSLPTKNFQCSPSNSTECTDNRNIVSSFLTSDEKVKEVNLSENWKAYPATNVDISKRVKCVTEPNINSLYANRCDTKINDKKFQNNNFNSNYDTNSNFSKNVLLSTQPNVVKQESSQMNSLPLNVPNAKLSLNTPTSHLFPEICSSTSVLKGKSTEKSVSCFVPENYNTKSVSHDGITVDENTLELTENAKTSQHAIPSVQTSLIPDSVTSGINESFLCGSLQNSTSPINTGEQLSTVISDNHVTKSLGEPNMPNCGEVKSTHLIDKTSQNFFTNTEFTETNFSSHVVDSGSVPAKTDFTNELKPVYIPQAFSNEKDKNFLMYSDVKPYLQNCDLVGNLKVHENFTEIKRESSKILPNKPNPLPDFSTFCSNKSVKSESNSGISLMTHGFEIINSSLNTLGRTKNIKWIYKVPKNIPLSTEAKTGEKSEASFNKSHIEFDSSQRPKFESNMKPGTHCVVNLQTSNTGIKAKFSNDHAARDIPIQIKPSQVQNNKQITSVNIPASFRRIKILKNKSGTDNVYLTSGIQTLNSTLTRNERKVSKSFQETSSNNPTLTNVHANENYLNLANNVENSNFVINSSGCHTLLSSNASVSSTVADDDSRNYGIPHENHNPSAFDHVNKAKNVPQETKTNFAPACTSNLNIATLTGNPLNAIAKTSNSFFMDSNLISSEVSIKNEVPVISECEHIIQTHLSTNFPITYSYNNCMLAVSKSSEISTSKQTDKSAHNIVDYSCLRPQNILNDTVYDGFQTLNSPTVSEKKYVPSNIHRIIYPSSSVNSNEVQFTKTPADQHKPVSLDRLTPTENSRESDISVTFQDGMNSGNAVLLPRRNVHQTKSQYISKDSSSVVFSAGYCNQVTVQRSPEFNNKSNKNPVYSGLNVNQTCLQSDKKIQSSHSDLNVRYLQPVLTSNQVSSFRMDDKSIYSSPKNISTYPKVKFDSVKQQTYKVPNKTNQISGCVSRILENSLVLQSNAFENSLPQEPNVSKLTMSSIPLDKDNNYFKYASQNICADSNKLYENLHFKIPVSTNELSSTHLNSRTVSAANNLHPVPHNTTVMYLQPAKMNSQEATYNSMANGFNTVYSFPTSVNLASSTTDSAKRMSSMNGNGTQSKHRVLNRRHGSPNILRKKGNSQNFTPSYIYWNPNENNIHSGNLSHEVKNVQSSFQLSYATKKDGGESSKACRLKNSESTLCSNPEFFSDTSLYTMFNSSNPASSSNQYALPSSEKNNDSHFSDLLPNRESCNISNLYPDSGVQIQFQDLKKIPTSIHTASALNNPNAYLIKCVVNQKDVNNIQVGKKIPSTRDRKKDRYDVKYVRNVQ